MKRYLIMFVILAAVLGGAIGFTAYHLDHRQIIHATPIPLASPLPAAVPSLTKEFIAALDVARVFGRSTGCAEADPKLITTVADEAVKTDLDPRILAATIAVESACNQYATSSKGAIGLAQIMPKIWKGTYDFEKQYNLLNPQDNIHVGASILGSLVKQYGVPNGLRRYNGLGVDCDACDAGYTDKIAALAAKR